MDARAGRKGRIDIFVLGIGGARIEDQLSTSGAIGSAAPPSRAGRGPPACGRSSFRPASLGGSAVCASCTVASPPGLMATRFFFAPLLSVLRTTAASPRQGLEFPLFLAHEVFLQPGPIPGPASYEAIARGLAALPLGHSCRCMFGVRGRSPLRVAGGSPPRQPAALRRRLQASRGTGSKRLLPS